MKMLADNHKLCLLLNCDYTPLSIITWKKALVWSFKYENNPKYGIEIIDFYKNDFITGINKKHPVPAIAKTKRFFKINKQHILFSRKNIFLRDNFTCQYCNTRFSNSELTYDHVIPKSKWDYNKGSPTSWTNIVTACIGCNRKKGNKTPKQANMTLHNFPIEPHKSVKYLPVTHLLYKIKDSIPDEWVQYLPDSYIV
jgi:hypothetical protein